MAIIKKAGVIVLSLMIIFSLVTLTLLISLQSLLNVGTYTTALEDAGVYDFMEKQLSQGQSFIVMNGGIRQEINNILSKILDYINGKANREDLTLTIDQEEIKRFYIQEASKIRICDVGETPWATEEINCRPANLTAEEAVDLYFQEMDIELPGGSGGKINLLDIYDRDGNIENIREAVRIQKIILYALIIFILILAGLIMLIDKKEIKKAYRTIGFDLVISGIIILSIVYTLRNYLINDILAKIQLIGTAAVRITQPITQTANISGGVILGIGIITLILTFLIRKKNMKEKNEEKTK